MNTKQSQIIGCKKITLPELTELEVMLQQNPEDPELWLEKGLKLSKQQYYLEAIDAFSHALSINPNYALAYRFRGHRYISTRQFWKAVADLELSKQLDPSNWDTWYHLALAHYLLGQYDKAANAYQTCLELTPNDSLLVAVSDWYWMTLKRLGQDTQAEALLEPIHAQMDVGENIHYHRRLLMYRGELEVAHLMDVSSNEPEGLDLATYGYGLGVFYELQGSHAKAIEVWQQVLSSPYWPAFGYIAAEVEIKKTSC